MATKIPRPGIHSRAYKYGRVEIYSFKIKNGLKKKLVEIESVNFIVFGIVFFSILIHVFYMASGNLLVEETYYWNYAQHLDFGYLDHPPMVALLIKVFTIIFGTSEIGVRIASLFCWLITVIFSYKLSEAIKKGSGIYSIFLLSFLPFFFIQSIVITPDSPLLACWSASLYFLYSALVDKRTFSWYLTGISLGLGMLSKYTICLLSLPILAYMIISPAARYWFTKKEPYLAALISLLLFTPVIYWNATHDWISFTFQSTRRFEDHSGSGTFELLWVSVFFLTPLGIWGVWKLFKARALATEITSRNKLFVQCFSIVPWGFFFIYSFNHNVNLNWAGPIFLGALPWFSLIMLTSNTNTKFWFHTAWILLLGYLSLFIIINLNQSTKVQQKLFVKIIAWDQLILQFDKLAQHTEQTLNRKVVFVPLDNYPINSELAFYQKRLFKQGKIKEIYPSNGAHLFNRESLMYRFWAENNDMVGKAIILLSKELWRFDDPEIITRVNELSPISEIWSVGQGQHLKNIPYYYKVVELKA